jgi:hypothetical protein
MSEANAIAYGIWHLKLSRKEIDKAIPKLGTSKTQHTFALFSHLNDFLYVDNVKMEECDDNDRQQNR